MTLFREFIDEVFDGSQAKAAAALDVDRSLVSRILRGERSITPDLAQRIETVSDGRFRKESFIWPEPRHTVVASTKAEAA